MIGTIAVRPRLSQTWSLAGAIPLLLSNRTAAAVINNASVLLQRLENKSIRRLLLWLLHQKRNSETHIGQNDGNARMRERERRVTKILSTNEQQKKPGWQRTHCKVQNLTKMLYRLFTRLFLFCISHYYATIYD